MALAFPLGKLLQPYAFLSESLRHASRRQLRKIDERANAPKRQGLTNLLRFLLVNSSKGIIKQLYRQVTELRKFCSGRNNSYSFESSRGMNRHIRIRGYGHIYFQTRLSRAPRNFIAEAACPINLSLALQTKQQLVA